MVGGEEQVAGVTGQRKGLIVNYELPVVSILPATADCLLHLRGVQVGGTIYPEFESWQPPVEPNHLIRGPFDADTEGTK